MYLEREGEMFYGGVNHGWERRMDREEACGEEGRR